MLEKLKTDIEILLNNGVELLPLNKVKIGNNTKNDFGDNMPECWNNAKKTPFNKNKVYEALNAGCVGFIGRTGKRCGLMVVDVDNGKKKCRNPDILPELINKCKFYIKTPNGYHFLFKSSDYFKIKSLGVEGNIDILTNDNIFYFGIREDGIYSIVKNECIEKMPDNIRKLLIDGINKKDVINNNNQVETPYKPNDGYFITDDELLKIFDDLPTDYNDNRDEWLKISSILKKAGFKDVWDDWSKKSNKYNKINNESIFKRLSVCDDIPDLNFIINIINNHLANNKYKPILKIYKPYEPLSRDISFTKIINERHLNADLYKTDKDIIIKSSLGTGKTYSTFQYIHDNNIKILSICQLINNVDNHIRDFHKHKNNTNERILTAYDEKDPENININGLCSTIDSLLKVYEKYFINNDDLLKDYVIYLDEIHSDLLHILTSTTLNNKRADTMAILCHMLKNCKQIIMTDGNISNVVLRFYNDLNRPNGYEFIYNKYKSFDGVKVIFKNEKSIYNMIETYILINEYCQIATNTKKRADKCLLFLQSLKTKYNKDFKILLYTSTDGEKIENVNEEWRNAYIIFSPSIISGLDRTSDTPEDVICFIDGCETINAEQICQQIARNRNIRNVYICYKHISNTLKYNSIEETESDYINRVDAFYSCPIFKQLCNRTLTNHKYEYKINDFSKLFIISKYHNNILKSNVLFYVYEILTSYGFIFSNKYNVNNDTNDIKILEKSKVIKTDENDILNDNEKYKIYIENIKNDIENIPNKYNNQLNRRLELINIFKPRTAAEKEIYLNILNKYENILSCPHSFDLHLTFKHFIKKYDVLRAQFQNNHEKDFNELTISHKIPKLLNIMSIMKTFFNDINIYDFSYNEADEKYNEKINMSPASYNYIKEIIRTKKDPPRNKRELLKVLYLCYKSLLGDDIFITDRHQKRINGIRTNHNIITFNNEYLKHNIELIKYSLIFSKSTTDKNDLYDKYIIDIINTLDYIKKPSTIKKEHDEERKNKYYEQNREEIEHEQEQARKAKEEADKKYNEKEQAKKNSDAYKKYKASKAKTNQIIE